jgi:hypothetical protein
LKQAELSNDRGESSRLQETIMGARMLPCCGELQVQPCGLSEDECKSALKVLKSTAEDKAAAAAKDGKPDEAAAGDGDPNEAAAADDGVDLSGGSGAPDEVAAATDVVERDPFHESKKGGEMMEKRDKVWESKVAKLLETKYVLVNRQNIEFLTDYVRKIKKKEANQVALVMLDPWYKIYKDDAGRRHGRPVYVDVLCC